MTSPAEAAVGLRDPANIIIPGVEPSQSHAEAAAVLASLGEDRMPQAEAGASAILRQARELLGQEAPSLEEMVTHPVFTESARVARAAASQGLSADALDELTRRQAAQVQAHVTGENRLRLIAGGDTSEEPAEAPRFVDSQPRFVEPDTAQRLGGRAITEDQPTPLPDSGAFVREEMPTQPIPAQKPQAQASPRVAPEVYRPIKKVERRVISEEENEDVLDQLEMTRDFILDIHTSIAVKRREVQGRKARNAREVQEKQADLTKLAKNMEIMGHLSHLVEHPYEVPNGLRDHIVAQGYWNEDVESLAKYYRKEYFNGAYSTRQIDELSASMAFYIVYSCDSGFKDQQLKIARQFARRRARG